MVFLDLDGTLLNRQKQVSKGNQAALEEARKQGHQIILCSGRPLSAMKETIRSLDLEKQGCYVIAYNGAVIYDCYQKEPIFSAPLTGDEVSFLFEEAAKINLYTQTYDSNFLLTKEDCPEVRYYAGMTHMTVQFCPELPDGLTEAPYKVLCIDLKDHDRLERFRQSILQQSGFHLNGFFSCKEFVEFVRAGVSKGSAIQWMSHYLNIPMDKTIGMGDSDNDLPMLDTAAVAVAMQNATAEVKAHADYVTIHDCDHDGVAEALYKFVLI